MKKNKLILLMSILLLSSCKSYVKESASSIDHPGISESISEIESNSETTSESISESISEKESNSESISESAFESESVSESVSEQVIEVSTIALNINSLNLEVGDFYDFEYSITPLNASNQEVTWEVDDNSIIDLVNGKVEALKKGTATVTIISSNGLEDNCIIEVKDKFVSVTSISIDNSDCQITTKDTLEITYTLLPENATNKEVEWSVDKPTIATIDDGVLTPLDKGVVVVSVESKNGNKKDSVQVTIIRKVESISLNTYSYTFTSKTPYTLIPTINPENVSNNKVTWSSNNDDVATVSNLGVVTPISNGTATITVTTEDGNFTKSCSITVNLPIAVESISLNKSSLTIDNQTEGKEVLEATILPSNATNKTITWTSSNTQIATVEDGEITPIKSGNVTISAKTEDGNMEACCQVIIDFDIHINSITLLESSTSIEENKTYQINHTINATNGIDTGVSYTSSNTSIATVSNTGLISAVSAGETTIKVTSNDDNTKYATFTITVTKSSLTYNYSTLYNGYYSTLTSWTNGEDLKNKLNSIIRNGYTALKYQANWTSNQNADESLDDLESVDQVYSTYSILKTDNVGKTTYGWNREHAFAASLMCGEGTTDATKIKGRATDFHNLFASYCSGNTSRGNKNFGVASSSNGSITTVTEGGADYKYDPVYFEPSTKDKGRLSRAIFYMATMYKDTENSMPGLSIVEENVEYSKGNCLYSIGSLSTLINWSNTYAVDRAEVKHNNSVYKDKVDGVAQGNRNPYVDIPGLVDYVYGSKKNEAGTLSNLEPSCNYVDTSSTSLNNVAIKTAKRLYKVGETFSKSDYTLVGIKKNFAEYNPTIQDNTSSYTFKASDIGTKYITIDTDYNDIIYPVTVIANSTKPDGVYKMIDFTKTTTQYLNDSNAIPSTSGYTSTKEYKQDDATFTIYGFNNNSKKWDCIKCGRKNYTSTAYISTSKIDKKITKIVINFNSVSSVAISSSTTSIYVSKTSSFTSSSKINFTMKSNNSVTINIDSENQIENGYYKIEFDMPSFSENGTIAINSIYYYGE